MSTDPQPTDVPTIDPGDVQDPPGESDADRKPLEQPTPDEGDEDDGA